MAATVRGVGVYAVGTTSFVAAVPTADAPVSGDSMYIFMESSDSGTAAGTPTTPGGWTSLFEATVGDGVTGVTTGTVFGKIAGASEADVTVDGVGNHCSGSMLVIRDHGMSVITDTVVGANNDHGVGTTGNSTTGITVTADSLVILFVYLTDDALDDLTNVDTVANTNLASITEREDHTTNTNAGGGVSYWTATCAGTTTGATTWNHDTAANSGSVHLGIKPATAGTRVNIVLAGMMD